MPAQDRLNVFLEVFAELSNLFFYIFSWFSLRAYQQISPAFQKARARGQRINRHCIDLAGS